jgi:hypothetical protein
VYYAYVAGVVYVSGSGGGVWRVGSGGVSCGRWRSGGVVRAAEIGRSGVRRNGDGGG